MNLIRLILRQKILTIYLSSEYNEKYQKYVSAYFGNEQTQACFPKYNIKS